MGVHFGGRPQALSRWWSCALAKLQVDLEFQVGVIRFVPRSAQLSQSLGNRHASLTRRMLVHGGETEGFSKGVSIDPDDGKVFGHAQT